MLLTIYKVSVEKRYFCDYVEQILKYKYLLENAFRGMNEKTKRFRTHVYRNHFVYFDENDSKSKYFKTYCAQSHEKLDLYTKFWNPEFTNNKQK